MQPANTPASSSCVAPRHDAHKQRATLLRTPSPLEMTAQPTSGAPGSKNDEKMSPRRPRSAAPPRPVWSAATARTTTSALSEGAQPLETVARKAPGREEGPIATAAAGEASAIAHWYPQTKWTYHLNRTAF